MLEYNIVFKDGHEEKALADDDPYLLSRLGNELLNINKIYEVRELEYDILYYIDTQ